MLGINNLLGMHSFRADMSVFNIRDSNFDISGKSKKRELIADIGTCECDMS